MKNKSIWPLKAGDKVKDLSGCEGTVIEIGRNSGLIRVAFGKNDWRDLKPEHLQPSPTVHTEQEQEGFTGGDWTLHYPPANRLNGHIDAFAIRSDDDVSDIALVLVNNNPDESEANAALIAESKNMYALLKEWHLWWCTNFDDALDSGEPICKKTEEIFNRINTALK